MAVSLQQLAHRMKVFHPDAPFSEEAFMLWLEEGWKEFVFENGRVWTRTEEITITPGTQEYDLPTDYREMKPNGLYFYYAPRVVASISRTSNVVTVNTTTAHALAVGMIVDIVDCDDSFNGLATVATVPLTTRFTFAQTDDDEAGTTFGTVEGQTKDESWPERVDEDEPTVYTGWNRTQGEPGQYYFPDSLHVGFFQVPNTAYPVALLRYDALVADDWDSSADLPIPNYLEKCLLGYCEKECGLAWAGKDPKSAQAQALVAIGAANWQEGQSKWRKTQVTREQAVAASEE